MGKSFLIYVFIILTTSILIEVSSKIKIKIIKNLFITLGLSLPAFFAGIRYGVGTDYFSYVRIFNYIDTGLSVRTEPGFSFLNMLVARLNGNEHILFFLISFLTFVFIYKALVFYEDSISVSMGIFVFMLFFYNASFNTVRMVLSISISLFSYKFIVERNWWKFIFFALVSVSIHNSAFVIIPFYYLYNNIGARSRYFRIAIYLMMIIFLFNYQLILEFFINNIVRSTYYIKYLDVSNQREFGIGLIIINAPFIIPGIMFYKQLNKIDKRFKFIFFFLMIGFVLKFIGYIGADYLNRVADQFFIVIVLVVPFYYALFKKRKDSFLLGLLINLYVIFYWFYNYIYLGYNQTVPYITIFQR